MPKYFALRIFKQWLAENRIRFTYPPWISQIKRRGFEIRFNGVSPHISGWIGRTGGNIVVAVQYHRECIDIIADLDVYEAMTADGQYFCSLCVEPIRYKSREELWIQHSFEPLLEWVNSEFTASAWLYIFNQTGLSYANIKGKDTLPKAMTTNGFLHACPVVLTRSKKF